MMNLKLKSKAQKQLVRYLNPLLRINTFFVLTFTDEVMVISFTFLAENPNFEVDLVEIFFYNRDIALFLHLIFI